MVTVREQFQAASGSLVWWAGQLWRGIMFCIPDCCRCPRTPEQWYRFIARVAFSSLCIAALASTLHASWSCTTFQNEDNFFFFSGSYGIWTIQDNYGECQLWSVLFFSHRLDPLLRLAQSLAMLSTLLGMIVVAYVMQALQFQFLNWCVLVIWALWLVDSYSWFYRFNLWATFFAFTYLVIVLIVRIIIRRGMRLPLRWICAAGTIGAAGIFWILAGDVCKCSHLEDVFLPDGFLENITVEGLRAVNSTEDDERLVAEDNDDWASLYYKNYHECRSDFCSLGSTGNSPIVAVSIWCCCWLFSPWFSALTPQKSSSHNTGENHDLSLRQEVTFNSRLDDSSQIVGSAQTEAVDVLPSRDSEEPGTRSMGNTDEILESSAARSSPNFPGKVQRRPRELLHRSCYNRLEWVYLLLLGALYFFLVFVMIASAIENKNAANAPDTSHNFVTDAVCAFSPLDPSLPYRTFPSKAEATELGYHVAHCGECSFCSNPDDIRTYVETRETVAVSAKKCSKTALFGTDNELNECLEHNIGFTLPCTKCWADNMRTTAKYCLFTCLSAMLTGHTQSNNVERANDYQWLNQCIYCDEKRSGPAFVQCSGVARRRLGIKSEIDRNPVEQCKLVDVDYLNKTAVNYYFDI